MSETFVEPFFGSGAVLLGRPHEPRIETVNDKDCFLANFWRATQAEPEAVAEWSDWPVNECDLHARHLWLVTEGKVHVERLKSEPDYFDCKIAGWWVWGLCQWIGSGWCLGGTGRGVHRPSQQLPHLGNAGVGVLYDYFAALAERMRRVRVCCGDWSRVCGPTPTVNQGLTGVFLDPPYPTEAGRDETLYSEEDLNVAHDAAAWAIEHGDDKDMRIAFCGYEGTHVFPDSWECVPWKTLGGYGNAKGAVNVNAAREQIWFSKWCLKPDRLAQGELFA